ncbi:MAG: hypothetical protein PHQ24_12315 [Proteiniphilum sp.]|nr:hypothetical protein [Proteiniphilum sp.]
MAIFDLFSKRQKKLRGDVPDVYVYDNLPQPLRVQIVHIWTDTLGKGEQYWDGQVKQSYEFIVNTLCREYGLFKLPGAKDYGDREYITELANFFLQVDDVEKALDAIELSFRVIDRLTRSWEYLRRNDASERADQAISELNSRLKEHGVGFQFVEGEIVRVDSELLHVEAVKPALRLLNEKDSQGAQQEFLSAYEHYRHGKNKEALNDCLKAFESTMKAICDKRKWSYQPNATAKALIQVCFDNNLVPSFWQQQLSSLRSMLESSIPTGRNKLSGHGQGAVPTSVPEYLVAYMLHMTASTLVFLTNAEKNLA